MPDLYNLFFENEDGILHMHSSDDNDRLQDEADRINSNLAASGIPSNVACAWVA